MAAPRFGGINLVLEDVAAASRFLTDLGVEVDPTAPGWADWAAHHQSAHGGGSDVDVDLDSTAFAHWWGGVPPELAPGVVVNLAVERRDEVDRLHQRAIELGATELRAPWDAFWGSRFSAVLAPGPLCVGLMSPRDATRRSAPPAIDDFA
jgi:hypothetical protein